MVRPIVIMILCLFAVLAFAPTAQATHEWGHRYMIFGRVLDEAGQPAQNLEMRITVETTKPQGDPIIPIRTDCNGLYYTFNNQLDEQEMLRLGMEAGVLHIHESELPHNSDYRIMTEHGNETGKVRPTMHRSTVSFTLDNTLDPVEACGDAPDWTKQYVVTGRVQKDLGDERRDQMTIPEMGVETEVEVFLQTVNGTENLTVNTNRFGDYFAVFEDVEVEDGAAVRAVWDGAERTGAVDLQYRISEVNIVERELVDRTTLITIGIVLGGIVVLGAAFFGFSKLKEQHELKQIRASATRKRANK